jgi:hypothetical protein
MPFPSDVEPMNLYSFRQTIRDVSRPYLFMIEMPNIDTNVAKVTAFARTASLPKYSTSTIEVPFQSQKLRLAGPANIEGTWQVEFLCDELHALRNRFMSWVQTAYDIQRLQAGAPVSYKYDLAKVVQLSRNGSRIATYQFVGLFPTSVGDIQLSHEETGWSKFPVEFAYDYFTLDSSNPYVPTQNAFQISATGIGAQTDLGALAGSADINAQSGTTATNGAGG